MTNQKKLLNKYYKGETSLEEEMVLKEFSAGAEIQEAEQDMFAYFEREAAVPEDLEASLIAVIGKANTKPREKRMLWYSIASTAAVVAIILTVFINVRNSQRMNVEIDFFVMEQALLQVSESLQPDEQQEMLVLWVDDDVEIIMN